MCERMSKLNFMKTKIIYALLIPFVFSACENQESHETTVNLGFKAVGKTLMQEKAPRSAAADGMLIDTAILILEKIDLRLQGSEQATYDPNNYILRGPYSLDLIARKSRPELLPAEVAPGVYTILQAMLYMPEGYHFTMHIAGTYTNNTKWWRFIYEYSDTSIFRVENSTGINIVEGMSNNIWVLIDVVALFEGVDFSKAVPGTGNVIRINSSSNTALSTLIEGNFEVAAVIDAGKEEGGNVSNDDNDNDNSSGDKADNGNDDNSSGNVSGDDNNGNKDKNKDKDKDKDKNKDKKKQKVDNNKVKDKDKNKEKDKDEH